MLQDSRGFLWIGTEDGLNLYDGYEFHIYRYDPEDSASISNNTISALKEDKSGNIWIATDNGGLNKFDIRSEKFTRFVYDPEKTDGISDNYVSSLLIDTDGEIWLGTFQGLDRFDPSLNRFRHYRYNKEDTTGLSFGTVTALAEDSLGYIWIGSFYGLDRLEPDQDTFTHYGFDSRASNKLCSDEIMSLYTTRDGVVWIGTTKGVDNLDPATGQVQHIDLTGNPVYSVRDSVFVNSIFEDSNGLIWIGTEKGLARLSRETGEIKWFLNDPENPGSINDNSVLAIMEDSCGILWFGTSSGGLNKYNPHAKDFHTYSNQGVGKPALSDNSVFSVLLDSQGLLWVGTERGGLNCIDRERGTLRVFEHNPGDVKSISSNYITTIYEDSRGRLWIGTDVGLNSLDPVSGNFRKYRYNRHDTTGIGGNVVYSIAEDSSGSLWLGFYGDGVDKFDVEAGTFTHYFHHEDDPYSLSSDFVNVVVPGSENNLWIGTDGGGLNRYNPVTQKFEKYPEVIDRSLHFSSNQIAALYEDSSGVLWIGTFGGGLNKLDLKTGQIRFYTERDGLPNNTIYAILPDGRHLWMSTNRGLVRFDPEEETFHTFTRFDGLPGDEFNQGAAFRAANGEMFFGGINGLTSFLPVGIELNQCVPQLSVIDIYLSDTRLSPGEGSPLSVSARLTDEIELSYTQNNLAISFAALSYAIPEKNIYSYKLEGFDRSWSKPTNDRKAVYMNLDPGEYIFKLKGANNDEVWNEQPLTLRIKIRPPFWETAYFRIFILFLIVGIVYSGVRWRVASIRRQRDRLDLLVRKRTSELEYEKSQTGKAYLQLKKSNELLKTEIQNRNKAEEELRESEKKYRNIVDNAFDGIYLLRGNKFLYVNPRMCEMTGYSFEELTRKYDYDIIFPEDMKPLLRERRNKRLKGEKLQPQYQASIINKKGERLDVNIVSSQIRGGDDPVVIGIIRDMSEIKKLESQLRQSQKMEAIGKLAGGIAHDFNNILAVIRGYTDILLEESDLNHGQIKKLGEISRAVSRASNLVQQLLAYSRKQIIQPEVSDINHIINNIMGMLRRFISEDIHLDFKPGKNLKPILADANQLEQILINLIINARDAIDEVKTRSGDKRIIIQTSFLSDSELSEIEHIENKEGFIALDVIDTGIGIDENFLDRIFDPFFTTKEVDKGTGLGLSTVYGIVKQNKGEILVTSKVNEGTKIRILWPAVGREADLPMTESENRELPRGKETILLVEDDQSVMNVVAKMLESRGYVIFRASSAKEALEIFNEHLYNIDLLFTDVVMPEMSGKELYERMKRLHPHLSVVFASGYDREYISKAGIKSNETFIYKPFTMDQVVQAIGKALDNRN